MRIHPPWRAVLVPASLALLLVVSTACQQTAAPTPQQAAAPAAAVPAKLFLMVDVVQGSKNVPDALKALKSCVLNSKFPRNSEIVWRARAFDPATGELMDDKAISKFEVKLANGQAADMKYGPHPKDPPGEAFWTASWVVPKDAPTGVLNYTVLATDTKGRTGEFKPFSTTPSLLSIIDETYPDVAAKPEAKPEPKPAKP